MAGTRFKAENGLLVTGTGTNSIFEHIVTVSANLIVNADLLAVVGNLYVGGSSVIVGNTVYDTDILPIATTGRSIGNNTHRFDGYFRNVNITGYLVPSSNGIALGNTTNRWLVMASNASVSDTFTTNTANVSGTLSVTGATTISNTIAAGNTTISGFVNVSSHANVGGNLNVVGTSTFTGNVAFTGNVSSSVVVMDYAVVTSNTKTVSNTSANIVDSFPKTIGNSGKVFISVNKANTTLHVTEMSFIHDGTNIVISKYGELFNTSMGSFDADITGANVNITFTASSANTYQVRTIRHIVKS